MLSSEYRDQFELYRKSYVVDEWGEQTESVETVFKGFCKVVNMTGTEYWAAYEQHMENTMKFYCRWSPQLEAIDTVGLYLKWRGREFDVLSVENVSNRNFDCTIKAKAVE